MNITFNGRVYSGPLKRAKRTITTANRAKAVRRWGGAAVKHAETNHIAQENSIMAREWV